LLPPRIGGDQQPRSDADVVEEIERLHTAASILRRLARLMISQELGVSADVFSGD
jgi:hypothetical protein